MEFQEDQEEKGGRIRNMELMNEDEKIMNWTNESILDKPNMPNTTPLSLV